MKKHVSVFLILLLFGCSEFEDKNSKANANEIAFKEFQSILDDEHLKGSILVYSISDDQYYSNDFDWARKGRLPASTFKIPNSIIALELGIVESDSSILKWDGKARKRSFWEKDLSFQDAFRSSCVPCYQEIARELGLEQMKEYVEKLDYGSMQFDAASLDNFWLMGDSKINQFQQIDFLKRLYQSELPISKRTAAMMKKMMRIAVEDDKIFSGKTGWSVNNEVDNGWFVGHAVSDGKEWLFATNFEATSYTDMKRFGHAREGVTRRSLKQLGFDLNSD